MQPSNLADITDWSDAEILKVLRNALLDSAIATQYSIRGRQLIRSSPTVIQSLIEIYERRVAEADPNVSTSAVAVFAPR